MSLNANALTTIQAVRDELGIASGDASQDRAICRLINAASDRIASYCNRTFQSGAAIVEAVAGFGGLFLLLSRTPLISINAATFDGETIDVAELEIHDAGAGIVRRTGGVLNTAGTLQAITLTPIPGTERKLYAITYNGGYVTPAQFDDIVKGTAQAGTGSTMTLAATDAQADDFYNGMTAEIVSGTGANQQRTITDYVGSTNIATMDNDWATPPDATSEYALQQVRTLPFDIEDACIEMAVARMRSKGRDPNIRKEKMLSWSTEYWGAGQSQGGAMDSSQGLPSVLEHYRRIPQA